MPSNPVITSAHNPFFRNCLRLRDNRKRKQSKLFLIDGKTEIIHAITAGLKTQGLITAEKIGLDEALQMLCYQHSIPIQPLSESLFKKLATDSGTISRLRSPSSRTYYCKRYKLTRPV